jgi:uncharacterized cupin superfamily protein
VHKAHGRWRKLRLRAPRYVVSGTLHIASDDGAAADLGPGDAYRIEPGHDAWVLGDEPFIALEFESMTAETNVRA